jgi:hypothetical protein
MSELYFKRGKRYYHVPDNMVSMYDQGRPADGIWEIRDNGKTAHLIGDLPSPMRIQLDQYRDRLEKIIMDKFLQPEPISFAEVVSKSLDEFALILDK